VASPLDRALPDTFIGKLAAEANNEGWWADVLADPTLVVALRGRSLNVYWHGQSLFYVRPSSSGLRVTTHEKYLLDPALNSQVSLANGRFEIERLRNEGLIGRYEGRTTLEKMKKAAGLFSKLEKIGCHEIAVRNSAVIDCEIAFPGKVSLGDGGENKQAPRIDLASLEADGDKARLVFWEAKHYSNPELRAKSGPPPVLRQVKIYEKCLSEKRDVIERSYTKVAANLIAISEMGWKRRLSPLITGIGTGKRKLTLGAEPTVGLIIFGFDIGQRDDAGWKTHLDRLKGNTIPIRAVGNAKALRLPA
jgi:hypothetical protein